MDLREAHDFIAKERERIAKETAKKIDDLLKENNCEMTVSLTINRDGTTNVQYTVIALP